MKELPGFSNRGTNILGAFSEASSFLHRTFLTSLKTQPFFLSMSMAHSLCASTVLGTAAGWGDRMTSDTGMAVLELTDILRPNHNLLIQSACSNCTGKMIQRNGYTVL